MYDELVGRLRDVVRWANKGIRIMPSVCLEAADAIEELSARADAAEGMLAEQPLHWIPVTEQPPLKVGDDSYNGYLVLANGYYEIADYAGSRFDGIPYFHVDGEYEPYVTHFMPLPQPPKEEV